MDKVFYTYIMTNAYNTVFYTGITNNLLRRAEEHISHDENGFTQKYRIVKIVWYETFSDPITAIVAEKKIKGWTRKKNRINQGKQSDVYRFNERRIEKILHFIQDDT
jgi:putative endonuclease